MSNELESDRAMVMNLERFGVDGVGYDETETEPPRTFDKPAVKIMFPSHWQVTSSDCTFPA